MLGRWFVVAAGAWGVAGCGDDGAASSGGGAVTSTGPSTTVGGEDAGGPTTTSSVSQSGAGGDGRGGDASTSAGTAGTGGSGGAESPLELFPAPRGCAMAHCSTRMSDLVGLDIPRGEVGVLWHDEEPAGVLFGVGCSSNSTVVACSYTGGDGDNIVIYDAAGTRLWTSGGELGPSAWKSAPIVDALGGVVAADDDWVIRFDPDGSVRWKTATPGGSPISPVVTASGVIVLATQGGPLSAYRGDDGVLLGALTIKESPDDDGAFETVNTPSVDGDRIYLSTQRQGDGEGDDGDGEGDDDDGEGDDGAGDGTGWLVAVDVDPDADEPMTVAWHFAFGAPSGGSPLRIGDTIYFDGAGEEPGEAEDPHVFGIRDLGPGPELRFAVPIEAGIQASPAQDPRGGFWVFPTGTSKILRLDESTGETLQELDIDVLVDDDGEHSASSVMSIAGPDEAPVMLVGAADLTAAATTYATAIDLTTSTLEWKVAIAPSLLQDFTAAQFPIVLDEQDRPVVVFPGARGGAFAVGLD